MSSVHLKMHKTETNPYLDLEMLHSLEELSPPGPDSLVAELSHLFTQSTPALLEELGTAVAAGKALVASRLAHRLKGSAANIGAKQMSELCAQLERSAQSSSLEENIALVAIISTIFNESVQALQSHIKSSEKN